MFPTTIGRAVLPNRKTILLSTSEKNRIEYVAANFELIYFRKCAIISLSNCFCEGDCYGYYDDGAGGQIMGRNTPACVRVMSGWAD